MQQIEEMFSVINTLRTLSIDGALAAGRNALLSSFARELRTSFGSPEQGGHGDTKEMKTSKQL